MATINELIKSVVWRFTRKKTGIRRMLSAAAEFYLENYYDSYGGIDINGERFMLRALRSKDFKTVFDVGANVGEWSQIAADYFPQATVHAFELSASTYKTTIARLSDHRFVVNNLGLSDVCGVITYKDYGDKSGVNTIVNSASFWDDTISVERKESRLSTGDVYCEEHGIDFIDVLKIDVEGADHLVLRGFDRMLTNKKIRVIQFEYGYTHADAKFLMRDFFALLNSKGYILGKLWADGVEFSNFFYWLNNFRSGPNYVAVRQEDAEIINTISVKRPSVFSGLKKPIFREVRQ